MTDFNTTGWKRYRASMVTADDTPPVVNSITKPSDMIQTFGYRGGRFRFLAGADGQAYTATFYAVTWSESPVHYKASSTGKTTTWFANSIVAVAVTGGTLVGVAR